MNISMAHSLASIYVLIQRLPMQIQIPSLAHVSPGNFNMRYILKNMANAGRKGTAGAMKLSFFLKMSGDNTMSNSLYITKYCVFSMYCFMGECGMLIEI